MANSDKDATTVRQSTRHKEDIYANASSSYKDTVSRGLKKPRRFRVDLPEGKKGITILKVIAHIKAQKVTIG